jgi:hypothetical protein
MKKNKGEEKMRKHDLRKLEELGLCVVTWVWPDEKKAKMIVPLPILANVVVMLDNDVRCGIIRVSGLPYDDYVRTYGGVILNLEKR